MNNKLKLGIDLDDVCCAFLDKFRQVAFNAVGKPLPEQPNPDDWAMTSWKFTPVELDLVWRQIKQTKNFWEHLGKCKGTENLKEAALDYQIYFITNRPPTLGRTPEEQACNWLRHNYDIEYPQVIVSKSKGPVAQALELFAFIDDKVENCRDVQSMAPTCKHSTYLRDQLHNRKDLCGCVFIRVPTLDTFLERLP